jgi:hypothetical protein
VKITWGAMKKGKSYLLLIFSCLLTMNPAFGLEGVILSMYQRFKPLPTKMFVFTLPFSFFIQGVVLFIILKCAKNDIQNPSRVVLSGYIAVSILIAQFIVMYKIKQYAAMWYVGYLLYDIMGGLITMIVLIINAQQVAKYCKEGYEGFSINIISGAINVAVILSNTLGTNTIGWYLAASHYSEISVTYTAIFSVEIAIIPFLLACYFLRTRK